MRSFLLLTGGLLLGAASIIFAAPVGNFEARSSSSANRADTVLTRSYLQRNTFDKDKDVHEDHHIVMSLNRCRSAVAHRALRVPCASEMKVLGWHANAEDEQEHATNNHDSSKDIKET